MVGEARQSGRRPKISNMVDHLVLGAERVSMRHEGELGGVAVGEGAKIPRKGDGEEGVHGYSAAGSASS